MRIKVRRMGVDELCSCISSLAPVPTISAGRSSFELMVSPAARAESTLMRRRIRLFSVANWIMTPRCAAPSSLGNGQRCCGGPARQESRPAARSLSGR